MLKAVVSYSKKIPVPNADYSSQGYSLSLETEITANEPAAIQAQLHDTFELVKASVEEELANGNAPRPEMPAKAPPRSTAPRPQEKDRTPDGKASNKQIKFVTDLASRKGLSLAQLNSGIRKRFGVDGLYDLSRHQASALLDELKGLDRKAA